jgi:hypothetical protein
LASIANRAAFPLPSCLFAVDILTQRREWIDVELGQPVASGLGICADETYVYHVCQSSPDLDTYLVVLERPLLKVVDVHHLDAVQDGHSVIRYGDELLVVSTGTDQIIAYPLRGSKLESSRVMWSPTDSGTDTHHVNSITLFEGDVLCSAFGPKDENSWATADNGYIRNVSRGEVIVDGLQQPHSVAVHDGELFFCNSLEGSIDTAEAAVAYLYGYSRGLAFGPDGTIYAATSMSRRPSDPNAERAIFRNPGDEGELHGQCALIQMTQSGANRIEVPLANFANEIYDLFVV